MLSSKIIGIVGKVSNLGNIGKVSPVFIQIVIIYSNFHVIFWIRSSHSTLRYITKR